MPSEPRDHCDEASELSDDLFDPLAVELGAWEPGPYGRGDQLGTYHEVSPAKTAAALATLDLRAPIRTFDMGETIFSGYPAHGSRQYAHRLAVAGWDPGPAFDGEIIRVGPRGPTHVTSLEERVEMTFNIASKVNGLHHVGVGHSYYAGRTLPGVVADVGGSDLDTPTWGPPLVTRGFILDVLADRMAEGDDNALSVTLDGKPILTDGYRITLEVLQSASRRQRLPEFEPGDAIFLRTGWGRLIRSDPDRFLAASPGVWLRECRWFGQRRPALLGTDSWMWGATATAEMRAAQAACHQEMFLRFGVRLAEGFHLDEMADAFAYQFVFCHNPMKCVGAVSSNSPAFAIANFTA